ncbi:MAG: hypothetical protein VX589_03185 [Myxococcota bacterium]|nr:hypothetical protein [Myxococcota bacterium]
MGQLFERILLFIIVLQIIQAIYRRLLGGQTAPTAPTESDRLSAFGAILSTAEVEERRARGYHAAEALDELRSELGRVHRQLTDAPDTRLRGLVQRVKALSQDAFETSRALDDALRQLDDNDAPSSDALAETLDTITSAYRFQSRANRQLGFFNDIIRQNQLEELRPYFDGAKAIASDFFSAFRTRTSRIKDAPLIACLAYGDQEFQRTEQQDEVPIIQISPDLEDEPERWIEVIDQCTAWLMASEPNFTLSATSPLGPTGPPWLPRQDGHRIIIDLKSAIHHWTPVLGGDVLGTAWLGPAYGIGLLTQWTHGGQRRDVNRAYASREGRQFSREPPHFLRFHLILNQLENMGFTALAHRLNDEWDAEFPASEGLLTPTLFDDDIIVPWSRVLDSAAPVHAALCQAPFDSLSGRSISNHLYFGVTPSHWQTVLNRKTEQPVQGGHSSGTVREHLMAALMQVLEDRQGRRFATQSFLLHLTRRTEERQTGVTSTAPSLPSASEDLRDAFWMSALFGPRRGVHPGQGTPSQRWQPSGLVGPTRSRVRPPKAQETPSNGRSVQRSP